jgi:hypothetical protein
VTAAQRFVARRARKEEHREAMRRGGPGDSVRAARWGGHEARPRDPYLERLRSKRIYNKSAAGRESEKRYASSPKGQAARARARLAYVLRQVARDDEERRRR